MKKMLITILALCCVGGIVLGTEKRSENFLHRLPTKVRGMWYGSYKLLSPTFSFTGVVPAGATQLEIRRKGEAQEESFMINTEKWSEFSLHFRLGY
jgi:hypothetical protein